MEWFTLDETPYISTRHGHTGYKIRYGDQIGTDFIKGSPVTVLVLDKAAKLDHEIIRHQLLALLGKDDVMLPEFLDIVLLVRNGNPIEITASELEYWSGNGFRIYSVETTGNIRSGPYYATQTEIRKVYKLDNDDYEAFMMGIIPDDDEPGAFKEIPFQGYIPLPSRLYYDKPTTSKPLRGKRIAVKDIFDLQGLPTSVSSRDYRHFTGVASTTAPLIQRLLDAGAVIVGKTKTTQFAAGEHAHDWVDYSCPFNPRGDGYMEPDGSNTGNAVAAAGYPWLDFAICTDTIGSIGCTARAQGVFGIRPTWGNADLSGVVAVSSLLDAPGLVSRSIADMHRTTRTWFKECMKSDPVLRPQKILYPDEQFARLPKAKRTVVEKFVSDLEKYASASRTEFDLEEVWEAKAGQNDSAREYLKETAAHIQLYDAYHNTEVFREGFKAAMGRAPYVNPLVRYKWDLGSKLSKDEYRQACQERDVFQKFLRGHVFDEQTIMVIPETGDKLSRDKYGNPNGEYGHNFQGFGFSVQQYSTLGGLPEVIIPVGQIPSKGVVTGAEMYEPVCVGIIGAPNMDVELLKMLKEMLKASGRPLEVKTGSNAFPITDGADKTLPQRLVSP